MSSISIEYKIPNSLQSFLKAGVGEPLEEAVFDVSGYLENKATENIKARVYSNAPSPRYKRTGRALGGHRNTKLGRLSRRVTGDTRFKGASKNYMPYLNRNRRIKKLNTGYWDDAVEDARNQSQIIVRKAMARLLKKVK